MWKNILEPDRSQMIMWCMRVACWIPKATNIYSQCVMLTVLHVNSGHASAPHCYMYVHYFACYASKLPLCALTLPYAIYVVKAQVSLSTSHYFVPSAYAACEKDHMFDFSRKIFIYLCRSVGILPSPALCAQQ